jgi:hypothetical protein
MNDEYVKRECTKEKIAPISTEMKARIIADDIVEIINGFDGPTAPVDSLLKKGSNFVENRPLRN